MVIFNSYVNLPEDISQLMGVYASSYVRVKSERNFLRQSQAPFLCWRRLLINQISVLKTHIKQMHDYVHISVNISRHIKIYVYIYMYNIYIYMCVYVYIYMYNIYIYMATTPRTYLRSHPIAMPTHQQHFQCQLKSRNKTNKKHKNFGNNKNTLENFAKNFGTSKNII